MKILSVVSGLDFINFTRRASLEAIHKLNPEMDILMFNSVLNIWKQKKISEKINFYYYHFWVPESIRTYSFLSSIEHLFRYIKWRSFFSKYEVIFFIDPNQYYLLPYLSANQKLIYLLRDPSLLQNPSFYDREKKLIIRADLILGISKNLCSYYFEKYYGFIPSKIKYWPNNVDLDLWNHEGLKETKQKSGRPLIGLGGNINYVIDIDLLIYLVAKLPQFDFEIAGKLDLKGEEIAQWDRLIKYHNLSYVGFVPYNQFPEKVINWDIGIVAAKQEHEYSRYLNNNKQYQYLALGKPFVTFRLDADYEDFGNMVFIAESKEDFIKKIELALQKSSESGTVEDGIKIAKEFSAKQKAQEFIEFLIEMQR